MKEHDIKSVAELRPTTITINDVFYLSIKHEKKLSKIYKKMFSKDINLNCAQHQQSMINIKLLSRGT